MELKVTRWNNPEPPTQSELVRAMEAEGLAAYIEDDEPNHSYEAHTHPNDEVLVAVLGEITMGVGDQKWVLKPGDRLDLPANTLHWAETPSTGPIRLLGASIGDAYDPTRADRSEETRARP